MSPSFRIGSALWLALALSTGALAAPGAPSARPRFTHPETSELNADPMCIDNNGDYVLCSTLSQVEYYYHRVVSNPMVWVVFWTDKVDATTQAEIPGFYTAVTNSELFDWMIEYNTEFAGSEGSEQRIGRGVYAGSYTITPTINTTSVVADADIQAELTAQMNNGQLPQPDYNSIFMVYFPPDYVLTQSGGDQSCTAFCAYHSSFPYTSGSNSLEVFYGVYPDVGSGGCQNGCGGGATFNNLCSASTHELIETVTDAEISKPDYGHLELNSFAWNAQPDGNEVGDMCNQFTSTINSIVDGTQYTIQQIFSQNTRSCETEYYFDASDGDFQFYANPTLLIVAPGTTGAVQLTSQLTELGSPAHALSLTGSLTGVTPAFDKTTLQATDSTYLRFTAAATAGLNTETLYTVAATPGPQIYSARTAGVLVRIEPQPTQLVLTGVTNGGKATGTVALHGAAMPAASRSLYFTGLYIDDVLAASGTNTASYSWDTSTLTPGSQHTVTLFAEDYDGGNAQLTDTVTIQGSATVELTSPAAGAVTGLVTVTATGAPATGTTIAHLNVSIDGTQVATGAVSPVTYSWDTTQAANGTHSITATIADADGTSATATPVSVTIHNLPKLTITPGAGVVSGVVTVTLVGTPLHGQTITGMGLLIDQAQVAGGLTSPLTYTWDTTQYPVGSVHTLVASVNESDGASNTATENITVVTGPAVSLTAPTAGTTVSDTVTISAQATAATGTTLVSLAVAVDGTQLDTGSSATLSDPWDTKQSTNGAHVITAIATDADGGQTTASATVTVANAPPVQNGFTLALTPTTGTIFIGGAGLVLNLTTTSTGTAEAIALAVSGLPPGVLSSFSPASVTAGQPASLTLTAPTGTAPAGSTVISVGGTSASVPNGHATTATITVEAGGASSGCSTGAGWELFAMLGAWPLFLRRSRANYLRTNS